MNFPSFQAQLFGPGLPSQGVAVQVELRSRSLVVHDRNGDSDREDEVGYGRLQCRRGGWHGGGLCLEWQGDNGLHSLAVLDAQALAGLEQGAPPELLQRLGRPRRRKRALGFAALFGLLGFCALVGIGLVAMSGLLVDVAARKVPPDWEVALGDATVLPYRASGRVLTEGEAARAVADIGQRLAARVQSPYEFRWILVDDPSINALAAPGGAIVVFSGLVNASESAEELAGVLAHEVQHVVLRHSLRGIVRGLGTRLVVSLALGSGELGSTVASAAERLSGLQYSRRQESDADAGGVTLLQQAGIDPQGLARFFDRLATQAGEPPAFLSTHPASADRARRVRALAAATSPAGVPAAVRLDYDWARVRAAVARR